mgnify:CR=1 FL=1
MDNLETELDTQRQMLNHIKQLLGDMILKQKQIDRMSTDINQVPRPRGRPIVHHSTQEKREKYNQYHKNYYHASKLSDVVVCEICHKNTTVQKLKRHQGSLWCAKHRLFHNDI